MVKTTMKWDVKSSSQVVQVELSQFLDLRGNLGNVIEKPTEKTCFFHERST